ncbi:MAG: HEPN domain-containing protein [Candidatus Omnitrophica bacterium]|nr:HEPN domain-containing protein [Candidatus Omnitrophota bacterium]
MNYEEFLKDDLIKKQNPDFKQIERQLKRAQKDLKTAESNLSIDLTWTFTIAYHAMIRAGRALMYSKGYLPTTKNSHKTIIEFAKLILGTEFENLLGHFNRMRRRRHEFIYDSVNHVTFSEVKSSIDTARKLIEKIIALEKKENPEKDLFR